jgi:hypothetical protein
MKVTIIREFDSEEEMFEHLQYIEKANLGFQTDHNLIKQLDWLFDSKPNANHDEVKEFIQQFINKNL